MSSFWRLRPTCRSKGSCSAATAGRTSRLPPNIAYLGHVYTRDHNAFNASARAVLNVSRDSMAAYGYSPATRVFEAAGASSCIITDAWEGISQFFEPGREILVAPNGPAVAEILAKLTLAGCAADRRGCPSPRSCRAYLRTARRPLGIGIGGRDRRDLRSTAAANATASRRHSRSVDYLVLGQRPRDHLPQSRASPFATRSRCAVPRTRHALVPGQPRCGRSSTRIRSPLSQHRRAPRRWRSALADADLVIIGSYVPEGIGVGALVQSIGSGIVAFYDIDTPVTSGEPRQG